MKIFIITVLFINVILYTSCKSKNTDNSALDQVTVPAQPESKRNHEVRHAESASATHSEINLDQIVINEVNQRLLNEILEKWRYEKRHTVNVDQLDQNLKAIALDAVLRLEPDKCLSYIINFIKIEGKLEIYDAITTFGLRDKILSKHQYLMSKWLLTQAVIDGKSKESLFLYLGENYQQHDLANYFEEIGSTANGHNCQCHFLTGYCSTMANSDPEAAVKLYKQLALPKHIDSSGLVTIISNMPPNTDFLKIAATEIGEDNKTLAKRSRTALLENWAAHKPAEAAHYVMTNTSIVHADQMAVVMNQWAKKAPDDAAKWLAGFESNAHKDQGYLALAKNMQNTNPAHAFAMANSIGNYDLKVKTATESFTEWAKTDRKAAEAAWLKAQ